MRTTMGSGHLAAKAFPEISLAGLVLVSAPQVEMAEASTDLGSGSQEDGMPVQTGMRPVVSLEEVP